MEMTKSQIIAEIEQCKQRIEELEKLAKDMKDDDPKVWKPGYKDLYMYINDSGNIQVAVNDSYLAREALEHMPDVLMRDSVTYKNAVRFGLIKHPENPKVEFYFEKVRNNDSR